METPARAGGPKAQKGDLNNRRNSASRSNSATHRKTARRQSSARPALSEPVIVAQWWKNRRGEAIRVRLSTYEGTNIFDVRSWFTGDDGTLRPGKGFAAAVKHLPRLAEEIAKAAARAAELGLIEAEEGGNE